jgi:DNA-binding response OmpR family regulator
MPQVAVVDDDPRIRTLLQEELEDEGIDANLCASGLELFQLLESQTIDLIFLDLMMPEMDGMECLRRLREIDYQGRVVLVTALNDDSKRREAMEAGSDDYILKPDLFDRLPILLQRYSLSAAG